MSEILILVLSVFLIAVGFVGCFVHKIPGPLIAYIGLLVFHFSSGGDILSGSALFLCALAVVLSMVLDRKMPQITKFISKFGKGGKWGCILGSFVGLLLMIGMKNYLNEVFVTILIVVLSFVVIPFALAYTFETIANKSPKLALMPAVAAYVSFFAGMLVKLGVCVYCLIEAFDLL